MPRVKPVVFISSTAQDLREHREAAARAARQAGFDVEMMDDFEARSDHPPYAGCMKKVRECDVVVALVAQRYGWVPGDQPDPKSAKSITWLECEEARGAGKELLVFVLDSDHPWPAERKESYRAAEALEKGNLSEELQAEIARNVKKLGEFKAWLGSLGFRKTFTTPDSVNSLVQESLHKWKERHPHLTQLPVTKDDPAEYLRTLRDQCAWIDIRGLQVGSGKAYRFPIHQLYIPLTTGGSARLEEALRHRHLVIEGDPGAGKTTFLRRIAWELCTDTPTLELPERGFPIYLRAGDLEEHIHHCRQGNRADAPTLDHAPEWLAHCLAAAHPSLDAAFFVQKLGSKGTWVLVDGLDEATNETMRGKLVQLIEAAARRYKHARFVVTTRPAADVKLFDSARVTIAELDDEAIGEFLTHWSRALHPDSETAARAHEEALGQALHSKPGIRRMARNPVMLTALAVVHWNENHLPEQVAELYESITNWLIKAKEDKKAGREPGERVARLLAALALEMQRRKGGRVTQVSRATAAEMLAPQFAGDLDRARQFITTEEIDSGIFLTRGADLRFWHLTLQEYLAARAIAGFLDTTQYELLIQSGVLHHSEWREVMRLFGQVLCKHGMDKVEAFFGRMLDAVPPKADLAEKARWVGLMGVMLGDLKAYGYALADARYRVMLDDVLGIFELEKSKSVPFKSRLAAADALGQAGDPRLRSLGEKEYWISIPGGNFVMGDGGEYSGPPREVQLKAFDIGQFPVTVSEYGEFLEHHPDYKKPRYWEEQSAFGNRPVVGVTWHDAEAYCAWASQRWHRRIRLLTEAEWERAARGAAGRSYAWGDQAPEPELANFAETRVGHASPVGLFPAGVTPEPEAGIADLTGNVDEWCADGDGNGRGLRGGAFRLGADFLRAAVRGWFRPGGRDVIIGFRCAREPLP